MIRLFRIFVFLLICALTISSCRPKAGVNAYQHMKVKPSQQEARDNKRVVRRQAKMYRKQMLTNRKHLFGRKRDPQAPKN